MVIVWSVITVVSVFIVVLIQYCKKKNAARQQGMYAQIGIAPIMQQGNIAGGYQNQPNN